jgi:hypothetical protein
MVDVVWFTMSMYHTELLQSSNILEENRTHQINGRCAHLAQDLLPNSTDPYVYRTNLRHSSAGSEGTKNIP